MTPFKLIIGSKAYSSWSLRPWLLLAHFKIPFEEILVPLRQDTTKAAILKFSPSGKVPALVDGKITVWESIAIFEYIAEVYPDKAIWPRAKAARAHARALVAEMHAGFQTLRSHCPTNFRSTVQSRTLTPEASADVARIEAAWAEARGHFGKTGPFLYGKFSAADAMFAPVVNRLHIYDVPVSPATRTYMNQILALPAYQAWVHDSQDEPRIEAMEV
jgi:glutathione S-transferase